MNAREVSIGPSTTIRETLAVIDRGGLGLAIVIDDRDRLIGMATDGDIRRALLGGATLDAPVSDAMRRDPVTVREGASPDEIRRLSSDRIRHIPVLDDEGRVTDLTTFMLDVRIPVAAPRITERALRYVTDCIVSNWISSGGPYVQRFEQDFAAFCDAKHAVATSNGTTALHLALAALGVGPGDEVIVPTLTFVATANAVRYVGATPVFVDSERRTWNLDPERVIAAITDRTRAIIPVHLYGHPAELGPILDAASKRGIHVIEDAAEAHGALYRGHKVGALGTAGCFSFYGNKIITTGEGGMVVTNDDALARRLRFLRDHAMDPERKYWHTEVGFNYRLTNLQAAVGVAQMEEIDSILERKAWQAATYRRLLGGIDVTLPPAEPWATNVHWMFSVLLPAGKRDAAMAGLSRRGVDSRPFFSCIHLMPMYGGQLGDFPIAEELSERGINLPSGVDLTRHEIEFSVDSLRETLAELGAAAVRR